MSTPVHLLDREPNYDRAPAIFGGAPDDCTVGWEAIGARLRGAGARVLAVEAYPGVHEKDLQALAAAIAPDAIVDAADALKDPATIDRMVHPDVTDDPVFGRLTHLRIEDFLDPGALERLRATVRDARGTVVVLGVGASVVAPDAPVVYAGMPRWENTLRQRRNEFANLGAHNAHERPLLKYKRAYFVDWRVADRLRKKIWDRIAWALDTVEPDAPKLVAAETLWAALARASRRPFRVVPYFDPAPWGGQWMKTVCGLDPEVPNYGWCFDCVPEENSLLLSFGATRFEWPSIDLVYRHPRALLGEAVHGRFGDEFPIRFDFLDTMGGGNLSLQVHPLTEYIQDTFGMHYTQDESYYLLDAEPDAGVYLGVREGVDRHAMVYDLRRAEAGEISFPAEKYVNRFPAQRHDHFLIPAGTLHCSSRCMVLEISATPYIFTFKLWDWDRPGLDGLPRPVHIDHGERVIRWERDTAYARARLINRVWEVARGDGWVEERTGLHEAEFIETRRHWFDVPAPHAHHGGVSVLNLVEGEEAVVTSPDGAFDPFVVHYAETFIVPADAGPFAIAPHGRAEGTRCATIKAFVRKEP